MRPIPPSQNKNPTAPTSSTTSTSTNNTSHTNQRPPVPALGNRLKNNNTESGVVGVGSTTTNAPQQQQGDHLTDHEKEILKKASKAWSTYQRPTFQGIGDEGRSDIQNTISGFRAYEFLLRQEEAKRWIEDMLDEQIFFEDLDDEQVSEELKQGYNYSKSSSNLEKAEARNIDFFDQLRDGTILCRLAEVFSDKGTMKNFHKNVKMNSPLAFMMATDNINNFQDCCDKINFPRFYQFSIPDLWERKNITKVVHCIHALAHFLWRSGKIDASKRIQDLSKSGIQFSRARLDKVEQEFKRLEQKNIDIKLNFNFSQPGDEEQNLTQKQQKPVVVNNKASNLLDRFNKLKVGAKLDIKPVNQELVSIDGGIEMIDPEQCVVRGRGSQTAIVAKLNTFEIIARDQHGNDLQIGGDHFTVTLRRIKEKDDDPEATVEGIVTDLGNGIYKVDYVPEIIGKYDLDIRLDGKERLTHPTIRPIRVVPGEAYGKNCEVVDEYEQMQGPFVEGQKIKFKIYARDQFGNYCNRGGDKFYPVFSFTSEDGEKIANVKNRVTINDLQNGEYEVEVYFPLPGTYNLSMTVNQTSDLIPYLDPFVFDVHKRNDPGLAIKYEQFYPYSSVIQYSLTAFDPAFANNVNLDNPPKLDTRWVSVVSNSPVPEITDFTATEMENNIRYQFNEWMKKARRVILDKLKNDDSEIDVSEFEEGAPNNFYWNMVEKYLSNEEKCNNYKDVLNNRIKGNNNVEFVNYVTITEDPQDWTQYELFLQQQLEEEERKRRLLQEEEERKRKELEMLEEERKKNVPPPLNPNQFSVRPRRMALNFWVIISKMLYDATQTTKPFQLDKTQKILGYETNELSFTRYIAEEVYLTTQRYHVQTYGDLLLSVAQRYILELIQEVKITFPDLKYRIIETECNNIGKNAFSRFAQSHKIFTYFCSELSPSPFDEIDLTDSKKRIDHLVLSFKRQLLKLILESNLEMVNLLKNKMRMSDKDVSNLQAMTTFFKSTLNDVFAAFRTSFGYTMSSKPRKIMVQELYYVKNRAVDIAFDKSDLSANKQEVSLSYSVQIPINKLFDSYSFSNEGLATSRDRRRDGLINPYKTVYLKGGRVILEMMRSGSFPAYKLQDKKQRQAIAVENAKTMLKALAVNHVKRFTREELELLKKRGEPLKVPFTSVSLLTPSFVQNREDRQVMEHQGAIYYVLQNNLVPSVLVDLYDRLPPIDMPIVFHEPCLLNFGVNVIIKTFKCGVGIQRSVNCRQFGIRQFEKKVQRFMIALGEYKNAIRGSIMEYITGIFNNSRDGTMYVQALVNKLIRINNVYTVMRDKHAAAIRELTPLEFDLQKKQKELEKRINEKWLPKFDDITSVEFTYLKDIMFLVNDMDSMIDKIHDIDQKWEQCYDELIELEQHFLKSLFSSVSNVRATQPQIPPIPHWQEYYEFCNLERDMYELFGSLKSLYHAKQHEKFNQGIMESDEVKVGDPYAIPVRVILLSFIIGEQIHYNCKSGKDRTGALMDECEEFAELREHLSYYPKPFTKDAKLGEYRQKIRTNISMNGGTLEICKHNIGFRAAKLDKTLASKFWTKKILDEKERVVGEVPYFKAFKGLGYLDDENYANKDEDWYKYENAYLKTL
ncbi:hypothetical protein C9374_009119 [Naegleria lovaniensis]|uniref:Calponin-homology (CH) domain-containing protein n=1 Tax=Naegleria lovaniensis TaxID=51637 RepID=A0AA88GK53_NAELO|nr:uncharacterized protein C9374_009119 [Naegleria lovaniensis]KAG2377603.1 hypothetical protein C9374_009119 [Naegleria lovaniensis]